MSEQDKCCYLPKKLCIHILDASWLVIILLVQGTILNYYIISHYKSSVTPYFLFIADFICMFSFIGTLATAYTYLKKTYMHDSEDEFTYKPKRLRLPTPSRLGVLPLSYTSWLFYTIILVTKICVIFESGLIAKISPHDHLGPQMLKVSMAASSFIFLLLVEGHNWAKRGTPRYSYVISTCGKTGIEIFDSISLLSLLLVTPKDMSETFKDVILILAAINFFLPSVTLYQLSLSDFAMTKVSLLLTVVYHILHLCLVDVPFLAIRMYLWLVFRENASMFLMKNLLSITLALRGMYPDIIELKKEYFSPKSVASAKRNPPKEGFEEIALNDTQKNPEA
ncbi:hypothetical protein AAG570_000386 [Ranatra chinensis]|uniref:Uncharacterized protein n=1 Tax=Ranatra chinensis TaxID=642074 RepID=A0ABD0YWY8_9HEMI